MDPILVYCTVPNETVAETIAKAVVGKKMAACVNIVSQIRSIYTWKDKIEDEKELLLIMKSKKELFEDIVCCIKELHPYEVPEVIAMPIIEGNAEYLNWIDSNTEKK